MAFQPELLTLGSGSGAGPFLTAQVSVPAGSLVVLATHGKGTNAASVTVAGFSETWEQEEVQSAGTEHLRAHRCRVAAAQTDQQVTITFPGGSVAGVEWFLFHVPEADQSGTAGAGAVLVSTPKRNDSTADDFVDMTPFVGDAVENMAIGIFRWENVETQAAQNGGAKLGDTQVSANGYSLAVWWKIGESDPRMSITTAVQLLAIGLEIKKAVAEAPPTEPTPTELAPYIHTGPANQHTYTEHLVHARQPLLYWVIAGSGDPDPPTIEGHGIPYTILGSALRADVGRRIYAVGAISPVDSTDELVVTWPVGVSIITLVLGVEWAGAIPSMSAFGFVGSRYLASADVFEIEDNATLPAGHALAGGFIWNVDSIDIVDRLGSTQIGGTAEPSQNSTFQYRTTEGNQALELSAATQVAGVSVEIRGLPPFPPLHRAWGRRPSGLYTRT